MSALTLLTVLAMAQPIPAPERAPMPKKAETPKKTETPFPGQAVLIILLPPDAELYINRCYMRGESARRTFLTPPLWPDAIYFYELRVNVVRDSRTYTEYRYVSFRAGDTVEVSFPAFPGLPVGGIRIR